MDPRLFVNDGSFMERFKQLQQQEKGVSSPQTPSNSSSSANSKLNSISTKSTSSDTRKGALPSTGKLAFSLKQKSKLAVASIKLGADEDEDDSQAPSENDGSAKRQKLTQLEASDQPSQHGDVAPASPSDPAVKNVADRLASFVAKNGRQIEHVTRQKNPGDTPFKFLFDTGSTDYKYYEYRLLEEEKILAPSRDYQALHTANSSDISSKTASANQKNHSNYQTPASALYEPDEDAAFSVTSTQAGRNSYGESGRPSGADPIAMMEFYMKKAAQEERKRQPKQSKDEMPPPASLQAPGKKGHHMGDYIPPEELEKFMASCNDAAAQKAAKETAERSRIQADNVGHKLLSKMGWKEGEGLGSSARGRADPIMAGNVKTNHLGVGAEVPHEVSPEDDIYEQYKKRMMLGYRHRPNPLGNPRKAYY